MEGQKQIGFIGTGIMGGRMCRNLAKKIPIPVIAFDVEMNKVAALSDVRVEAAPSIEALVNKADIILMCLPGEPQVRAVCTQEGGILEFVRPGQTVIDLSLIHI